MIPLILYNLVLSLVGEFYVFSFSSGTISESWKVLLGEEKDKDKKTSENKCNKNENSETTEPGGDCILSLLQQIPGCEGATMKYIDKWMISDQQAEVTDNEIVQLC